MYFHNCLFHYSSSDLVLHLCLIAYISVPRVLGNECLNFIYDIMMIMHDVIKCPWLHVVSTGKYMQCKSSLATASNLCRGKGPLWVKSVLRAARHYTSVTKIDLFMVHRKAPCSPVPPWTLAFFMTERCMSKTISAFVFLLGTCNQVQFVCPHCNQSMGCHVCGLQFGAVWADQRQEYCFGIQY